MAGVRVWMGGDNEEVCGGAGGDVVAGHPNASLVVQVQLANTIFEHYLRYIP